jgi:hypothetical protein
VALAPGVLSDDGVTLGVRHELTRQAIEGALSTPRRAVLHRRVAEALAGQPDPDHARIAHHADAAGLANMAARHAALAAADAEESVHYLKQPCSSIGRCGSVGTCRARCASTS